MYVFPSMETEPSCMASSSADCVLGGVRLISSARIMLAKIGPLTKTRTRFPVARSSSMISVPVMSAGIKSGVNWMRLKFRCSTWATVAIKCVLAIARAEIGFRQLVVSTCAIGRVQGDQGLKFACGRCELLLRKQKFAKFLMCSHIERTNVHRPFKRLPRSGVIALFQQQVSQ